MVATPGQERRGRAHPAVPLGLVFALLLALTLAIGRQRSLPRADFVFAKGDLVSYGAGRVAFMSLVSRHIGDPKIVIQ